LKKHINFKNIFEVKSFKNIKESFQLFLPQIAISIYTLLDKIMIGYLSDKENVSFYDISNKLVILSMILITTTGGVFLPRISNLYSNKKFDEIKEMVYKTSGIFSVISLPLIFGIIAVSDNLIKLLLPIEYFPVACSLKIMAITIIFWTYNNITGSQLLIPMGMENKLTISVVVGAVVNVVLNYFLIKQQGALGATIATVITEGIVTSIQIYYVRDFFRIRVSSFVKAFIGSLGMYILIAPLNNLFYQIGLGVGIYFIILIILKENVLFENINLVRDILKKRQLKFQK
jgi:O-antigen/teichoic acid export membrane protein